MPELSGPVQPFELARWLWLIPFFPLAGALTNALYSSGLLATAFGALRAAFSAPDARATPSPPRVVASPRTVGRIAIGSLALSAVASAVHVALLAGLPETDRFLSSHLWQMVRVGPLDVGADLVLDPLSAVLTLLVTVLGTLVGVYAVSSREVDDEARWRFFAWLGALVFFMLVLVLADNVLLMLMGWQGVGVAGYGLVGFALAKADGAAATRAFMVQRAADVGIVAGAALLFWGLGGAWDRQGEYQSELSPRLAAVAVTATDTPIPKNDRSYVGEAALKGKGFLTVAALPGSLVYLDESRIPLLDAAGLPLRTPFRRFELPGGAHSVRVAPDDTFRAADRDAKVAYVIDGGTMPNYAIPRTAFGADHEVALTMLGPTLKFREIRDELVLADGRGTHPGRDGFGARRLGGAGRGATLQLVTVACLLILIGALAKSAQLPLSAWLSGTATTTGATASAAALIQGGGMVMAGVYVVARLAPLFALSHVAAIVLTLAGIATAVLGALASVFQLDLRRVLACTTASQLGLAFVALGAGANAAAIFQITTHAVVKTCLLLAAGSLIEGTRAQDGDALAASDLRRMGGLETAMPHTAAAYRVGCVALTAVPIPLLAGFWSTGAVMEQTYATTALPFEIAKGMAGLVVITGALTSYGMWRSYYLAFGGARTKAKLKEASVMTVRVLRTLAVLAVVAGAVLGASTHGFGGAGDGLLEGWLAPAFSTVPARFEDVPTEVRLGLVAVALAVAFAGWGAARQRYGDGRRHDWASREASPPWLGPSRGAGANAP